MLGGRDPAVRVEVLPSHFSRVTFFQLTGRTGPKLFRDDRSVTLRSARCKGFEDVPRPTDYWTGAMSPSIG